MVGANLNDFKLTVGETVEIGNFDPKIAIFWIDSGTVLITCPSIYYVKIC